MESKLTDLEVRLAYQEASLEELTRTVVRQDQVIAELRAELEALARQVRELTPSNVASMDEETLPPHY
ncbi:MAG TPA: SlyX family protein [Gammaproteobacteria bacterium]|nr:SlyX family protein [Gammaproteobacteria bacterium]